jgi:L-fucose mutarotase
VLKGINPILTPELLMHLCAMGHGEWVAVVDANFTADYLACGKPVVRLPGLSLQQVSEAVLSVFPLATDIEKPAAVMHVCRSAPDHRTDAQSAVIDIVKKEGFTQNQVEAIERYAFYDKIRAASLIVQTGEGTAYGNVMFCKGVILL